MKHLFSAGIIVYRIHHKQIEYLLLQYATGYWNFEKGKIEYEAGHWDFAKGKIENGETKQEAALRELQEEAGISATIEANFEETFSYIFHDYDKQLTKKTVYFFIGEATSDTITLSHEHIDYAWLPYEQALERLTYDNAKELLKKAHKRLVI